MNSILIGELDNYTSLKDFFPSIPFIESYKGVNNEKIEYCIISQPKIINEGFNCEKYIKTCIENIKAETYIIFMIIPVGTISLFLDNNIIHLSIINKQNSFSSPIFIYGGDENICKNVSCFFEEKVNKNIDSFITDSKTAELSTYIYSLEEASNISIRNDLYNLAEECNMEYNLLDKLLDKIQSKTSTTDMITNSKRGYHNNRIQSDLDHLLCLMSQNNIHTFNIDGMIRSNIFNKRRSKNYSIKENSLNKIFFYNIDEEYGFLSNFSDHPIFCKQRIWKTVEHYFQAQKFIDTDLEEEIRLSYTPSKAKEIAKHNKYKRLNNWDEIKDLIMYEALYAKFTQHPDLKIMLKNTNTKELYEHCSSDFYWADGGDGSGKNVLGNLLMKLRNKINLMEI